MHKYHLRKSLLLLAVFTLTLLVLSSCSAVFKANLGGKVRDIENEAGIANMAIYAYTNTTQRDSDFSNYSGGTFNPSSAAGYVARTTSDNDGSFVINKVVWESKFPEFGKTADYKEIALLFYHEDYGLQKNSNSVWITSDSTNVSMVDEKFSKVNQTTNVRLYLRNAANQELIDESFDVRLEVDQELGDLNPKVERATVLGSGIIPVTYPVELDVTDVAASASLTNSTWMQCEEDGTLIVANTPPSFSVAGNNSEITLYLKQSRLSFPTINGEIDPNDRPDGEKSSPDNGLAIWLGYRDAGDGTIKLFDEPGAQVVTRAVGTGANNSVIRHGVFSDLGAGMTWDNKNYLGTYDEIDVVLVVDKEKDRELSVGDRYYEFSVRSDRMTEDLGRLGSNELIDVIAADIP